MKKSFRITDHNVINIGFNVNNNILVNFFTEDDLVLGTEGESTLDLYEHQMFDLAFKAYEIHHEIMELDKCMRGLKIISLEQFMDVKHTRQRLVRLENVQRHKNGPIKTELNQRFLS